MSGRIGRRFAQASYPTSNAALAPFFWQGQPSWILTGNPADDASPGTTIGTHKEFRRRIIDGPLRQDTTIAIIANLDPSDSFDTLYDSGGFAVTYTGTPSVALAAQTINAYTPRVVATNTPNQLQNTAALVWTPFIGNGFFVRMSSGPATGLMSVVALDVGANTARVGSFLSLVAVETQPVATNTFDIVVMPQVPNANRLNLGDVAFTYQNLYFTGQSHAACLYSTVTAFSGSTVYNCCFDGLRYVIPMSATFVNCAVMRGSQAASPTTFWRCASSVNVEGGVFFDVTNTGQNINCDGHMLLRRGLLLQGQAIFAIGGQGLTADTYLTGQDVGVFDVPASMQAAFPVREGAKMLAQTVWGNTGTANKPAVFLDRSGKLFLLGTAQTLTNGGGNEIAMVLTPNTTWAAARAAGGVKDGATSDASIMVVL